MRLKLISAAILVSISVNAAIVQPNPNIKYVPMPPMPGNPTQILLTMEGADNLKGELEQIGKTNCEFINRVSRNRILMTSVVGAVHSAPHMGPHNKTLRLIPGAASHVPIIGNGISGKHELGHEMGINHANTRIWETQTIIKQQAHEHEPFDPMTITPGVQSYNAPHIHMLEWYRATEEAYAEDGGEYILRVINDGNRDFASLKTLYYQVPNSTRQMWFSYVHVNAKGWDAPPGMPGTAVAIHESASHETYLEGLIGLEPKTNVRSGLILTLSEPTAATVKVKVTVDPTWVLQQ